MNTNSNQAPSRNPLIARLPKYNAGTSIAAARQASGRGEVAALASNENPYGCSPAVTEALRAFSPSRYSDPASTALRGALAIHLDVPDSHIAVGNGSEDIIAALSRAFLVAGDRVLTVIPSFGLHVIQPMAMGATVMTVPATAACGFDVPAILAALEQEPAIFFLSTPWNPVGPALTTQELGNIVAAIRPRTLLVLDEAYFEFRDAAAPDGLEVLKDSSLSWAVLRTFSKAYGLAGLRAGYAIMSDPEIARLVSLARTPFNVNAAAQTAALAALADQAWMQQTVKSITGDREILRGSLQSLGLLVAPSQGNFLFIDTGKSASGLAAALLKQGIITKAWAEPGHTNFLRVSIGLREENARFASALEELLASA
ncbi:aminotransferase class I/II-fold pyridoxal phosphate-dependent enzyme [Mesorhizobium sp. M8A.F.Ca.ET.173.01.1.1]|nr:aminotransferase class I/II-fold pyridoxal phosphate-dependent enzyme [Mesorhizobium sp. M8A.F.Ca.ET.173.01.1.1]